MKQKLKQILKQETESINLTMSQKLIDTPIEVDPAITAEDLSIFETQDKLFNNSKKFKFNLKALISCLCSFILIFTFSVIISQNTKNNISDITSYIIEINPSICITTDKNNLVVNAYSLNYDGDDLLSNSSFDNIEGLNFEDCLKSIINLSIQKGYINNDISDPRDIIFRVTNNEKNYALDKGIYAKKIFEQELINNGFSNYNVDSEYMPVTEFKTRMGFDKRNNDLDKMKDDISSHSRYYDPNFIPPQ